MRSAEPRTNRTRPVTILREHGANQAKGAQWGQRSSGRTDLTRIQESFSRHSERFRCAPITWTRSQTTSRESPPRSLTRQRSASKGHSRVQNPVPVFKHPPRFKRSIREDISACSARPQEGPSKCSARLSTIKCRRQLGSVSQLGRQVSRPYSRTDPAVYRPDDNVHQAATSEQP